MTLYSVLYSVHKQTMEWTVYVVWLPFSGFVVVVTFLSIRTSTGSKLINKFTRRCLSADSSFAYE